MVQSSILGFPRMGVLRDLKKATEAYWGGKLSRDDLIKEGKRLRLEHWKIQKDAGVDVIPSNDFAFYDQVLDHIQLFSVCHFATLFFFKKPVRTNMAFRLLQSGTPSTSLTHLMNTLLWAAVTKRMASMFRA
jgi:cobalamin-independent synthase